MHASYNTDVDKKKQYLSVRANYKLHIHFEEQRSVVDER